MGVEEELFLFDEVESIATLLSSIRSRLLSYQVLNTFTDARRFPNSLFLFATTLDFGAKIRKESELYDLYTYEYPVGQRFAKKWLAQDLSLTHPDPWA